MYKKLSWNDISMNSLYNRKVSKADSSRSEQTTNKNSQRISLTSSSKKTGKSDNSNEKIKIKNLIFFWWEV